MIRLKLLGSTELVDADGIELERILAQPKRLAVLAFLAASQGFHRRDSLLAMFWPELDPTRSRDALNQAVRFLRTELKDSEGSLVVSRGAGELGLNTNQFWCDAAAFRNAADGGRHAEALQLYRGDLLPGFFFRGADGFERWLEDERSRLRLAAARAALETADASEREGDYNSAIAATRRALELAGLDERAVRQLITRLDRMGDRAGALTAYDAFASRLTSELGAEASAETQAVVDQIRGRRAANGPGLGKAPQGANASPDGTSRRDVVDAITTAGPRTQVPARRISRRGLLIGATGISALTIVVVALTAFYRPAPRYFSIDPPPNLRFNGETGHGMDVAISRDGETFAFTAGRDKQLFIWKEDQSAPVKFPTRSEVYDIHFSPGGERLVYRSGPPDGGPTVLRIDGGPGAAEPVRLSRPVGWSGITWGYSKDVIYAWKNSIWKAPQDSEPRMIASMDTAVDIRWRHPTMLHDRKTIAFPVTTAGVTNPDSDRVALISIEGGTRRVLDLIAEGVIGYTEGALVFSRRSDVSGHARIMAVPVNLRDAIVNGKPVVLLDSVMVKTEVGAMAAMSANGTLAYLARPPASEYLQVVDSRGAVLHQLEGMRMYRQMAWSPDGRKIAMYVVSEDMPFIAVYDLESERLTKLADTDGFGPAWTPDGKRVAFLRHGAKGRSVGTPTWIMADGSSSPEPIPGAASFDAAVQVLFTPDGRNLVVRTATNPDPKAPNAFTIPLAGGPVLPTLPDAPTAYELAFSPNGAWLAYHALKEKKPVVYVQNVRTGARMQISEPGSFGALWSGDSHKLFFHSGSHRLVLTLDVSGTLPRVLGTDSLFTDRSFTSTIRSFDVHPNGVQFVVSRDVGTGPSLKVIENFSTLVRQKLARR